MVFDRSILKEANKNSELNLNFTYILQSLSQSKFLLN